MPRHAGFSQGWMGEGPRPGGGTARETFFREIVHPDTLGYAPPGGGDSLPPRLVRMEFCRTCLTDGGGRLTSELSSTIRMSTGLMPWLLLLKLPSVTLTIGRNRPCRRSSLVDDQASLSWSFETRTSGYVYRLRMSHFLGFFLADRKNWEETTVGLTSRYPDQVQQVGEKRRIAVKLIPPGRRRDLLFGHLWCCKFPVDY